MFFFLGGGGGGLYQSCNISSFGLLPCGRKEPSIRITITICEQKYCLGVLYPSIYTDLLMMKIGVCSGMKNVQLLTDNNSSE